VGVFAAVPARGQPVDPQALGSAQALFDSAEELRSAHRYDEACPKLEEVVRLVPSGGGAKMALARCYEEAGRLSSAWATYVLAANAAKASGQADRAKSAGDRAVALKPRLSALTIATPPALGELPGLEIKRDGKPLAQVEWGVPVAVDSGAHVITVTAPGKKSMRVALEVKGEATTTVVPLPEGLEDVPLPPPLLSPSTVPPPDTAPRARGQATWAWPVGGVGVILAGVSVAFLVDQQVVQASIDGNCPGGKSCQRGFDAADANTRLYRDFGMFVGTGALGLLGISAAVVGLVTDSKGTAPLAFPAPRVSGSAAGLEWNGRF
jgi:hypothetical protein